MTPSFSPGFSDANEFVGAPVIEEPAFALSHHALNEDDAARGEDRRRAGLDDAGIKFSGAARENRSLRGFGPVEKIARIREAHLVGLVRGGAEPVHPILAVDFFGDDGAGLGPTLVPVPF